MIDSQESRFWVREPLNRNNVLYRFPVVVLLIYYLWILCSALLMYGSWGWSFERGLEWSSGGPGSFFPVPSPPGHLTVITPAVLVDQVFYLVFMHSVTWIFWIIIGVLYSFSPYRIERTILCSLLKGALIAEIILFLLGATIVTNMHPRGIQFSVYGVGLVLLFTVTIWLIACKRRYSGFRVID